MGPPDSHISLNRSTGLGAERDGPRSLSLAHHDDHLGIEVDIFNPEVGCLG
jgi:hypothetical protein